MKPRAALPRPPVVDLALPRQAGFSLIELLVSLAVIVGILVVVLVAFDFSARLARAQLHTTGMQQALRSSQTELVRAVRMTGRGPLALSRQPDLPLPTGISVAVRNNVPAGTRIASCDCAPVLVGTDVLTLRGVFSSPIYQTSPVSGDFQLDLPDGGSLILHKLSPTGVPQDLTPLKRAVEAAQAGSPEALLLVSPLDDEIYAIVELLPSSTVTPAEGPPELVTLQFRIQDGTHTASYLELSAGGEYPAEMLTVAYAGLIEEYRYYVREDRAVSGDPSSELAPRLAMARLYPGTEAAYRGDEENLIQDVADNVFELQVALGIDTDFDGEIAEGSAPSGTDEWLFNHPEDDPSDTATWNGTVTRPTRLYYLRVTSVARTDRPDPGYQADLLTSIEDHDFTQAPASAFNSEFMRRFRRRTLETVVDIRNQS